jgi:hypothetical protein
MASLLLQVKVAPDKRKVEGSFALSKTRIFDPDRPCYSGPLGNDYFSYEIKGDLSNESETDGKKTSTSDD